MLLNGIDAVDVPQSNHRNQACRTLDLLNRYEAWRVARTGKSDGRGSRSLNPRQ